MAIDQLFTSPPEVVQFLSFGFAVVYEHESLSLRESRPLRAGEGQFALPSLAVNNAQKTLPGRPRPTLPRAGG